MSNRSRIHLEFIESRSEKVYKTLVKGYNNVLTTHVETRIKAYEALIGDVYSQLYWK